MVEAIQSRVDILGKSRKLPKNVTAEGFQTAKDGLDSMKSAWGEATASSGGQRGRCGDQGAGRERQRNEVMPLLGMNA